MHVRCRRSECVPPCHALAAPSAHNRSEPALEALRTRILKGKRRLEQQQQQPQRTVTYRAFVRDAVGHEQSFKFEHLIDSRRLAAAADDKAVEVAIMSEVSVPHHVEMMLVGCWV